MMRPVYRVGFYVCMCVCTRSVCDPADLFLSTFSPLKTPHTVLPRICPIIVKLSSYSAISTSFFVRMLNTVNASIYTFHRRRPHRRHRRDR